ASAAGRKRFTPPTQRFNAMTSGRQKALRPTTSARPRIHPSSSRSRSRNALQWNGNGNATATNQACRKSGVLEFMPEYPPVRFEDFEGYSFWNNPSENAILKEASAFSVILSLNNYFL